MNYSSFKYLYPPRASNKINPDTIEDYDNGEFLAQPKYNGGCSVLFLPGNGEYAIYNRHNEVVSPAKFKAKEMDLPGIHRGDGYMVVCGELMNKAKAGEKGQPFNNVFVIWDILVYQSEYLIGKTNEDRQMLLEQLFPAHRMEVTDGGLIEYQHVCPTGIKGVFKAPVYTKYFSELFSDLVMTDAYEGIVLKKRNAKLEFGFSETNNAKWQVKCRKETKNYAF